MKLSRAVFLSFFTVLFLSINTCSVCYSRVLSEPFGSRVRTTKNSYAWQSSLGNTHLSVSSGACKDSMFDRLSQANWRRFANFCKHGWGSYFARRVKNGIHPKDWHVEDRKKLFYCFELYQFPAYRKFLSEFPEYPNRIVEINNLRKTDVLVRERLKNIIVKSGFFKDKTVADFICMQAPRAKRIVEEQRYEYEKELRARKRQESIRKREETRRAFEKRCAQLEEEQWIEALTARRFLQKNVQEVEGLALCISDAIDKLEENDSYKERLRGRVQAIEKALDNGFNITSMTYKLSEETKLLLEDHEIDPLTFEICVGNRIQQEIRKELDDLFGYEKIINDPVPKIFKDALAKSISIVDEFSSKGFFAGAYQVLDCSLQMIAFVVGCGADIAESFAEAPFKVANNFFNIIEHLQDTCIQMLNTTRKSVEFFTDASIVLLNDLMARGEYLFHPIIVDEIREKVDNDLEFINRKVERASLVFTKLPFREKLKRIASVVAEIFLTAKFLNFLRKVKGKSVSKIIEAFESIRQRDRVVVTSNGVEIAVAQGADAIDSVMTDIAHFMDSECVFEKSIQQVSSQWEEAIMLEERIAENANLIRSMEQKGIRVADAFKNVALQGKRIVRGGRVVEDGIRYIGITDEEATRLKNIFLKEIGGEDILRELGLERAIIDEKFIKHFTSLEIKQMITRSGNISRKLSGCHVIDEKLLELGVIRLENVTGGLIKEADIWFGDCVAREKTLFQIGWSKERVIREVGLAIKKTGKFIEDKGEIFVRAYIDKTKVVIPLDANHRFITCYPETMDGVI